MSRKKKQTGEKHSLWKKILLSFVTLVILVGVGEWVCRLIYPLDSGKVDSRWNQHHFRVNALGFWELNEIMEPDRELFWRVKPNLKDRHLVGTVGTETLLNFHVTTDASGMREMGVPDGGENIVFLGDSCTFGIGVEAGETCAFQVAEALKAGARNLSCPGYTLYQGRRLLERVGWEPLPRALVAAFGFNDRLMWDGLTDPEHAKLLSRTPSSLARFSRLFYCVELVFQGSASLLKGNRDEKTRRVPPDLFKAEAKALLEEAKARGVPVIFMFWPRIEWILAADEEGGHPYAEILTEVVRGEGAAVLDLTESFRQGGGERLFLDGIHAQPEGHRIAAERVLDKLVELGVTAR